MKTINELSEQLNEIVNLVGEYCNEISIQPLSNDYYTIFLYNKNIDGYFAMVKLDLWNIEIYPKYDDLFRKTKYRLVSKSFQKRIAECLEVMNNWLSENSYSSYVKSSE